MAKNVTDSGTTYYAFRYICEVGDVIKYEYDTDQYCDGKPTSGTTVTGQLDDFECNLGACDYSSGCSYVGCYDNATDSCAECENNKPNYSRYCTPFITDYCMGDAAQILRYEECVNGVLTENFYSGLNCSEASFTFADVSGGTDNNTNCYSKAYYQIDCVARSLPACNYAATDSHYYPIGACDISKKTDQANVEYFAFKYVCNGGDIYRHEYNTSNYCKGTAISTVMVNELLEHYDCGFNDCQYADSCTLSLNACDAVGCDYDIECIPDITDNCIGHVSEILDYATCANDSLNINTYYGMDCDANSLIFADSYSNDETRCGNNIFHKVQCIDPADTNPVTYLTTQCTQAPTQSPTTAQPTENTKQPSTQPTTSPSKQPTTEPTPVVIIDAVCQDLTWKISITFRVKLLIDPTASDSKALIKNGLEQAFVDAIIFFIDGFTWDDSFCVDLNDAGLTIQASDAVRRRRVLLQIFDISYYRSALEQILAYLFIWIGTMSLNIKPQNLLF